MPEVKNQSGERVTSHDFGMKAVGMSETVVLTFTNHDDRDYDITPTDGFGVDKDKLARRVPPGKIDDYSHPSITDVTVELKREKPGSFAMTIAGFEITGAAYVSAETADDLISGGTTEAGESDASSTGGGDAADVGVTTHLLLSVPDYKGTQDRGAVVNSWLRIGDYAKDPEDANANKLLDVARRCGPQGNPDEVEGGDHYAEGGRLFIDDVRERGGGKEGDNVAPGHRLKVLERMQLSERLEQDTGWRDHSDGNRLTTTWGDKVEVIRGNYKMIVLGRQALDTDDDVTAAVRERMGWEASGSNIQDFSPAHAPGSSKFMAYVPANEEHPFTEVPGQTGAWLAQNELNNVIAMERFAGNFRSEWWGDYHETYIGSENPEVIGTATDAGMQGHPGTDAFSSPPCPTVPAAVNPTANVGVARGNPHVLSKTWAESIGEYEGSANKKVPAIYRETHATLLEEVTYAQEMKTFIGFDNDDYDGKAFGKEFDPQYWSESISTVQCAHEIDDEQHFGLLTATRWGPAFEMWMGSFCEMFVGGRAKLATGAAIEMFLGGLLEISLINKNSIFAGIKTEMSLGPSFVFNPFAEKGMRAMKQESAFMAQVTEVIELHQALMMLLG